MVGPGRSSRSADRARSASSWSERSGWERSAVIWGKDGPEPLRQVRTNEKTRDGRTRSDRQTNQTNQRTDH